MEALLSGLKILDFTTLLPGPFATMMLADLGADVLRIESPTRIDFLRIKPPYIDNESQLSCFHAYLNRNKKSIGVDFKQKGSTAIVERLIKDYDIIVEQFRPGVMERLGLSYEKLSGINPKLIFCSLTGYGQSGPLRDRAGHDINYLSLSGIMSYSGRKDTGPGFMGIQVADVGSGSYNTIVGILAAVIGRFNTGKGQYLDVSMTDCLFPYHALSAIQELSGGDRLGYETDVLNGGSLYGFYKTSDNRYISFGGIEPQFFSAFCDALELNEDIRSGGIIQGGNLEKAKKTISDIIKTKSRDYWLKKFKDADACFEPVLTFSEAVVSEHAKYRGVLVDVPGHGGKTYKQLAYPVKYSDFKPEYKRIGCSLGEDTDEIMKSCNYSKAEIDEMRSKGIIK